MSWAIGYDDKWARDIGYGVPAYCDHPDCKKEVDRGLGFVCGAEPYGGEKGCGLYFCSEHLIGQPQLCPRCANKQPSFKAKEDHPAWIHHKMTDPSWKKWRDENLKKEIK